jgi:hypothetical protein
MPADLEMKLDVSRVFWQGENAPALPFKFELASKGSSLAKIEVEFRVRFAGMEWQERRNIPNLASGVSRLVGQTTRPPAGLFGECTFEWTVSYEKGGRRRIFETDTFHRIYLMTEKAQEVVQNAIQTLNVNISTGHAADVTIGKLLDRYSALSEDKGLSVNDLIDALNRLPPAYLSLKLYEVPPDVGPPPTEWPPPGLPWPPPKEAVVNRLTLQYGERLVHLLSLNEMQLGKNKLCDVKTRLFTDDGQAPRVLNGAISRYHCRIVLEQSECRLIDGGKPRPPEVGEYKSSAGGTFVNGTRVPNPGHVVLKPEEEVLLTLAGQNAAGEGVFAMAACFRRCRRLPSGQCARSTSASCGAPNPPCSLELRRQDNVPEAFLNLWGHATLAAAGQELAGFRVWVYEGAFFFRSGSGYRWLVPGQPIVLDGGKKLLVGPYRQFGMDEG